MGHSVPSPTLQIRGYIWTLILFSYICGTPNENVLQLDRLKITQTGDSVNLTCMTPIEKKTSMSWFKQGLGEKPLLIVASYQNQGVNFFNSFDKSGRFDAQITKGSFNLTISNLEPLDLATYYCAVMFLYETSFGEGTLLIVNGAQRYTVLQQPVFAQVDAGQSVNLECTVYSKGCPEEHNVYWFRHGSEDAHPGIIYTKGGRRDQCNRKTETRSPTQSCVYNLSKTNLNPSDSGTYYCAVVTCGDILFGNGTVLDVKDCSILWNSVITLATTNIITVCVTAILARRIYENFRRKRVANASDLNQTEDIHSVNYASLSFARPTTSRRNKEIRTHNESLYAQVNVHRGEGKLLEATSGF